MCGIYGFTSKTPNPLGLLETMGRLQQHRGPDGEGHFIDNVIALGMRRLSIIDVEHGNQPFFSKDRSVAVVCNGEIYNYRELREDLQKSGFVFHTGSDVEVIPHLYDRYGMDFVHKLNGMYAIALYDATRRRLYLVRDRLGIKPLYYTIHRNELVFSSELKAILAVVGDRSKPDLDAFSTYLELLYIPAPLTPFHDIRKLEPASYLLWENNAATRVRYWDPDLATDNGRSVQAWMDDINALLLDSTDLELRSDVPLGSFLSGGVDSSLVTALAARTTPQPFSTFHMRWKDVEGKIDESVYARMVSERYGTRDTMRDVSQIDLISLLPKLVWHLEEPFADAAFVPTYLLANIAAEKVKVILSGAGGDELFGGYSHHKRHSLAKSLITGLLHGRYPAFNYFDMWKRGYLRRWTSFFPWFAPETFKERFEHKFKINKGRDPINAIMRADIDHYLPDDILFLTDKMTMAASVECRVPLLDHRLVELSLRIPSACKIRKGVSKWLLKQLGERYLPAELLYRPKEGFGSPVWLWVNEYKELYFDRLLEDGFLVRNGLLDQRAVNRLTDALSLSRETSWQYWQILILEIWSRLFIDKIDHEKIFELDTA